MPANPRPEGIEPFGFVPAPKVIALDLETTGLDADKDEILSIAIIGQGGKRLFYELVKPKIKQSWPGAQSINGISPKMVARRPTIDVFLPRIREILDNCDTILIYNKRFDLAFLKAVGIVPKVQVIDVMQEYASCKGVGWTQLGEAAEDVGVRLTNAHDACADATATFQIHQRLPEDFKRKWALSGQARADEREAERQRRRAAGEEGVRRARIIEEATPRPFMHAPSIKGDNLPFKERPYLCVVTVKLDSNDEPYEAWRRYCADAEAVEAVSADAKSLLASLKHGKKYVKFLDRVKPLKLPIREDFLLSYSTVTMQYVPLTKTGKDTKFPLRVRLYASDGAFLKAWTKECRVNLSYYPNGKLGKADVRTSDSRKTINSMFRERDGILTHVKSTMMEGFDKTVIYELP